MTYDVTTLMRPQPTSSRHSCEWRYGRPPGYTKLNHHSRNDLKLCIQAKQQIALERAAVGVQANAHLQGGSRSDGTKETICTILMDTTQERLES